MFVVDNLERQAHPAGAPMWVNPRATYAWCDFRDAPLPNMPTRFDAIVHLAAATGTGQSMYEGALYTRANAELTAYLADLIVAQRLEANRVVFASSRAVYGEGTRECTACGRVRPRVRTRDAASAGDWDPPCPGCGSATTWVPTRETDEARPLSVYGATKSFGEAVLGLLTHHSTPVLSMRFFNLYGPRQTPANPYVGVASTFASLVLAGKPLTIFEDGLVLRDFLHVSDAVDAVCRALDRPVPLKGPMNIGSGRAITLLELARTIADESGASIDALGYTINGATRAGDLRACIADSTLARRELAWAAHTSLRAGVKSLLDWVRGTSMTDPSGALAELERFGLLMGRS